MRLPTESSTRREFLQSSVMLVASQATNGNLLAQAASAPSGASFAPYQEQRRNELWGLLGDLPWQHQPGPPRLLKTEEHNNYTLERWVLDLMELSLFPPCC